MRIPLFVLVAGFAACTLAQNQQPQQLDKDTETRVRAERFAGGTGKITEEEKQAANVGAGPHKQFKPEGAARREPTDKEKEKGLESADARRDARRP